MIDMNMQTRVANRWCQRQSAPVRDIDKTKTYYHGTSKLAYAQAILREGTLKPPDVVSKGFLAPVKGRVYVTPTLAYAAIYAMGGNMAGSKWPEEFITKEPNGYLFTIAGKDLADIQPDEDSVGEILFGKDPPYFLTYYADKYLSDNIKRRGKDGDYMYYAKAGKILLKHLSDSEKMALIDRGAHVAVEGSVPFQQCWEFPKNRTQDLAKDASNFFDLSKRIR
jgi:hypothetical protein